MPAFGKWVLGMFEDSAGKPVSKTPSLPSLRACGWVAGQQPLSLLMLLGWWMASQLRTRETAPFAGLFLPKPNSAEVPIQVCHAEDQEEDSSEERRNSPDVQVPPAALLPSHRCCL